MWRFISLMVAASSARPEERREFLRARTVLLGGGSAGSKAERECGLALGVGVDDGSVGNGRCGRAVG